MLKWQLFAKPLFGNYISAGLLYKSAHISLSVTSVNNGNKERTCRCWRVPPRQSTCHQVAWPVPLPPPLLVLLLAICRSTDQTLSAMGSGEGGWWSWWRSGMAPFNTASTSNNSRLWQLCIIHLVESLSLPSLTLLSPSLLSVSLQFFFFFFFSCLPALGEGERENQGSVPSDAACFPLTPVILETQKCLSAARCPDSVNSGCHLNQIVFLLYWGSVPKSLAATWSVELLPKNTRQSESRLLISWYFYMWAFRDLVKFAKFQWSHCFAVCRLQ